MYQFETPILFIVFNRDDTAQRVFEEIKKLKPKYLYVAADGPRANKAGEKEKCQKTRDIVKQIDWDCELKTLFQDKNLGCAKGPTVAISWFFENVEQGIILEDDILPHPDFFLYCAELLEKYKDDERIALVSGVNYKGGKVFGDASYFFSCYPHTWGWGTWRRTWKGYDLFLENYTLAELKNVIKWCNFRWNDRQMQFDRFKIMKKQGTDGWDWQFMFHVWKKQGLTIIPNVNLTRNIGFGEEATHFKTNDDPRSKIEVFPILPLEHPAVVERNIEADREYCKTVTIILPYVHKLVKVRKSFVWWSWRWMRRQVLVRVRFTK